MKDLIIDGPKTSHGKIRIIAVLVIAGLAVVICGGIWLFTQNNWCDRVDDAARDMRSGVRPYAVADRWELDKGEPTNRFAYFVRGYGSESDVRSATTIAELNCRWSTTNGHVVTADKYSGVDYLMTSPPGYRKP